MSFSFPKNKAMSDKQASEYEIYESRLDDVSNYRPLDEDEVGVVVYLKKQSNKGLPRFICLGVISKYVINPHTDEKQFMVEGNYKSMYKISRGFVKIIW